MLGTKNTNVGLLGNSRKFNLLGDPSMRLGIPPREARVDERLIELNFGEAEGKTWPELNVLGIDPENDPEGYHAWRPEGGESYADATVRVKEWLDSLRGPTLAVAHGGISRIVRGLVLDLPVREVPLLPNPQWKFYRLKDGEIDWFRTSGQID